MAHQSTFKNTMVFPCNLSKNIEIPCSINVATAIYLCRHENGSVNGYRQFRLKMQNVPGVLGHWRNSLLKSVLRCLISSRNQYLKPAEHSHQTIHRRSYSLCKYKKLSICLCLSAHSHLQPSLF